MPIVKSCFQNLMRWIVSTSTVNIPVDIPGQFGGIIFTILLRYFLN